MKGILEFPFRGVVEDGTIEVSDRSPDEILNKFNDIILDIIKASDDFYTAIDHRKTLLDQARSEARAGHHELSVTLYAIWVEHFINGVLTRSLEQMGYGV